MVKTGEWIGKAWQMVTDRQNFWMFILLILIYGGAIAIASMTGIGSLIIAGPAMVGVYAVILNLMKTGRMDLNHLQDGFQVFLPAMLAGIVVGVFTSVGSAFCLLPGIIISALYLFPLFLILEKKMAFWDAMEESRKKVQEDLWGFVVFVLALMGVNLLGALACGIGLLVSSPVALCAIVIAYRELWPEEETTKLVGEPAPPQG
jgi:uncharacterized membrane protein